MAKGLKCSLIVLVPALIVLVITWLAPWFVLHDRLSPHAYALVDYGIPLVLVAMTAWATGRLGGLGRRASVLCGLTVVLPKGLLLGALMLWATQRDPAHSAPRMIIGVVLVLMIYGLVALVAALLGAWLGSRRATAMPRA